MGSLSFQGSAVFGFAVLLGSRVSGAGDKVLKDDPTFLEPLPPGLLESRPSSGFSS